MAPVRQAEYLRRQKNLLTDMCAEIRRTWAGDYLLSELLSALVSLCSSQSMLLHFLASMRRAGGAE